VLAAVGAVTAGGEAAGLVDLGHHLDPQAADAAGVDLKRVLWLRPRDLPQALAAAEALVAARFPLVAVDLGLPPVRGRAATATWLRLARAAGERGTVILVTSPYRLSGCAATVVLEARSGRGRWSGTLPGPRILSGMTSRLVAARRRGERPGLESNLRLDAVEALTDPPDTRRATPDEENRHVEAL
jgi:hypothetical protein